MAYAGCPAGNSGIPAIESMPIPQNINVMVRAGTNTSNHAMTTCCAPNRVQIVDGCYLWCEVPRHYFNTSAGRDGVSGAMRQCIRAANRGRNNTDESVITGWQFNAAGRTAGAGMVKQMGLWALLVSGLVDCL